MGVVHTVLPNKDTLLSPLLLMTTVAETKTIATQLQKVLAIPAPTPGDLPPGSGKEALGSSTQKVKKSQF